MQTAALPVQRNTKAALYFTLLLVFLCGTLVGAVAMSILHPQLHQVSGKEAALARFRTELSLTPAQTQQLETILDDFSQYYDDVLADGRTRVMQILNEQQKKKFDQMLKDRRR